MLVVTSPSPDEPLALRAAVAGYAAGELPGRALTAARPPDLAGLQLRPTGAGGGVYAGLAVEGFAYQAPDGSRIVVYLSVEPFPRAPDADQIGRNLTAWVAHRDGMVLLCASSPHAMLLVGEDDTLVRRAAVALGAL